MSSTLHITHLKLEWLRRRRDELRAKYAAIAARAAVGDVKQAVQQLRVGLAELRAGSELLHPEAMVLEDVLPLGGTGVAMETWRARLEQETAWGRARAEYGWLFAGLIEEWVSTADAAAARAEARCRAADPVRGIAAPFDLAIVDELAASPAWDPLRNQIAKYVQGEALEPVDSGEVETALDAIANGPYRSRALRRQARDLASDETLRGEYTGAIALLFDGFETWDWPASGVPVRVVEAIDRFRTYLDPELLDALLVEVIGARWSWEVAQPIRELATPTTRKTAELVERFEVCIDDRTHLHPFHTVNGEAGSSHYVSADAVFDGPDAIEDWLARLHVRIEGVHALHPGSPVYVAVADVAAMGPSLPHEVLDRVAQRVGIPDSWRAFIARYLAVPVRDGNAVVRCRRGIFPDQRLALALAETVMAAIEARIWEVTRVRVLRLVDDFAFVTADPVALANAWQLFTKLVAGAGLTLNKDKTYAMTVFGQAPIPAGIPEGPIRIGHLELGGDGVWKLDAPSIQRALVETRDRVLSCGSVFEAAQVFSDGVRVTLRRLSPFAPFGIEHVRELARTITRFYDEIGSAGIVAHLVARMQARMPDVDATTMAAGVWFWPRTAGGVGLFDATAQLAALHSSWRSSTPPTEFPREITEETMTAFDKALQRTPPKARQPPFSPEVEGRIADFVRRGDELRGEETDEDRTPRQLRYQLNFYWQWVVSIHSPTILDRFGTFRFVEASRVPFGAIVELGWLGANRGG